MAPTDFSTLFNTATTNLQPDLIAVAGIGLGIGVVVFGVGFGWRWLKGLIS